MRAQPSSSLPSSLTFLSFIAIGAVAALGCAPADPETALSNEVDTAEPASDSADDAVTGGTVGGAVSSSCSTASVKALSMQIIQEGNCISPGAYSGIPARSNLTIGSAVFPYLETPARDKLVATLDAHKSTHMTMNSALRTIAQQYLLYAWYKAGRCGIALAATPGNSNHETGLAFDIDSASTWRSALESHGFHWFGSADPVHFDFTGSGSVSHKGLDVRAFQSLWNRNHPTDKISVDGEWGPQTEARMKKAPAAGFAKGASCGSGAKDLEIDACNHDPSAIGAPLHPACSTCATDICSIDASCCNRAWSKGCVDLANQFCASEELVTPSREIAPVEGVVSEDLEVHAH